MGIYFYAENACCLPGPEYTRRSKLILGHGIIHTIVVYTIIILSTRKRCFISIPENLKIGRGGFILTNEYKAYDTLKRMRFDGRMVGVKPKDDKFIHGYHCYMLPEEAARGLMLMSYMADDNADLPRDDYADLSLCPIFQVKE